MGWFPHGLCVAAALIIAGCCHQRAPRRALPSDASDIHEQADDMGGGNDFTYWLSARMPAASFEPYAKSLGMTPHTSVRTYTDETHWLSFDGSAAWWKPTPGLVGAWVTQEGRCWTFAKHEAGVMFLKSLCH